MAAGYFPTERWAAWSQSFESIRVDLMHLGMKRVIHKAHREVLSRHQVEKGTGVVHRWMQENYADSMLMGLRRVIDRDQRTVSLIALLKEIESARAEITLDRYMALWRHTRGTDDDLFPRMLFSRFSSDGSTLDGGKIGHDIKTLCEDHIVIRTYIDKKVAHREKVDSNNPIEGPRPEVTWEDLDRLFDDVAGLFNEYNDLVNPGVHVDFAPVLPAGFRRAFLKMVVSNDG